MTGDRFEPDRCSDLTREFLTGVRSGAALARLFTSIRARIRRGESPDRVAAEMIARAGDVAAFCGASEGPERVGFLSLVGDVVRQAAEDPRQRFGVVG